MQYLVTFVYNFILKVGIESMKKKSLVYVD